MNRLSGFGVQERAGSSWVLTTISRKLWMINRRTFLGTVLGLPFGGPGVLRALDHDQVVPDLTGDSAFRQYLVDLAVCDLGVLGFPRTRSLIEQGHHPVAPDRVVVLDDAELRRFSHRHRSIKRRLRDEERTQRAQWAGEPLPDEKLDIFVGLMGRLTVHYDRADLFEQWSRSLFLREALASTGIGGGLGLVHDFQRFDTTIRTENSVVDWWLVLIPGGMEWGAIDERPVHFMVGPVMQRRLPGPYLRVMEAISRGLRPLITSEHFNPRGWSSSLASLSPADATREFNYAVVNGLAQGRNADHRPSSSPRR